MTWPPTTKTVVIVIAGTVAGWALLAVFADQVSLGAADMAASVISMFVGIAALLFAVASWHSQQSATPAGSAALPGPGATRKPMIIGLAVTAVCAVVVVLVVAIAGDDDSNSRSSAAPNTSPSAVTPVPVQPATSSGAPSPEACAGSVQPAGVRPTPSGSIDDVRHEGTLTLSELYSADLDSLCSDWEVTDSFSSGQDLSNDGTGLTRAVTGAQLAVVEKGAEATYAMCAANTDYLASTVYFDDIRVGDRYCARTDAGRRSLITVTKIRRGDDRTSVQLRVRTWSRTEPGGEDDTDYSPLIVLVVLLLLASGGTKAARSATKNSGHRPAGGRSARQP